MFFFIFVQKDLVRTRESEMRRESYPSYSWTEGRNKASSSTEGTATATNLPSQPQSIIMRLPFIASVPSYSYACGI